MQLIVRLALAALASFALGAVVADAAAGDSDPSCSMERMETDPASVIAPCSLLLNEHDLAPEKRAEALFVRGRGYHRTGRPDVAALDYDDALKLNPSNDEIYVSRANVAFRQRRYDVGQALLRVALKINPRNPHALRAMGAVHADFDDYDGAVSFYSKALNEEPAEPYALLFRSRLYARHQQFQDAFKDADALVAIEPDIINRQGYVDRKARMRDFHVVALKHRADLYQATGNYDLGRRDLDAAVNYKAVPEAFIARAEFLWTRGGQDEDALTDLDAATALDPYDSEAHDMRGMVLMRLRRPELALEAFNQALTHDPSDAYALRMRARVHRELDQTDEAVRDFEAAIRINPLIVRETMPALLHAGYWNSREAPRSLTPAFRDAIRACMLDKTCN